MTTARDQEARSFQATLLIPDLAVGTLDLQIAPRAGGAVLTLALSYTVISEAGAAHFDQDLDRRLEALLRRFGRAVEQGSPWEGTTAVSASRQHAEHTGEIQGDIDDCFTLACPVAELDWIDDWKFDLIYSESGVNEAGCAFTEAFTGLTILRKPGALNTWYATLFNRKERRFEAVWLTGDLTVSRWKVHMDDLGNGRIRVSWSLTYTGLGPEGDALLGEAGVSGRMGQVLAFIAASLKQYMETGTVFKLSTHRKLRVAGSLIGAALGRHLGLAGNCAS